MEHYEKDVTELNGPKEELTKAVCEFLSTLCVNKRQSDLKMAQACNCNSNVWAQCIPKNFHCFIVQNKNMCFFIFDKLIDKGLSVY